jgi:putative two-component system response regulator
VYVILLTSRGSTAERVRGLSAGADDFMTKPFEPQELLARMLAAERLLSLETRDVAIFAMAKLAESRDVETGAHLERVMNYSRVLAQQLPAMGRYVDEIDPEFVRLVYSTSPLHDIGKVGIPDGVLLKPGRLDDQEFEIMKTHAAIGARTLDAALRRFPGAKFLRMARDIAASHHERWDGNGYPAGLKGDEIPLCSRIVALADVYDALTSKRVYKNSFAHEVAKGIIVKDAGTHFDPAVVGAFLAAEAAFIAVREQYQESLALAA